MKLRLLMCRKLKLHSWARTDTTFHVGRRAIPRRIRVCKICGREERYRFNFKDWVRLEDGNIHD